MAGLFSRRGRVSGRCSDGRGAEDGLPSGEVDATPATKPAAAAMTLVNCILLVLKMLSECRCFDEQRSDVGVR
jgi:hypothetical protein